MHGVTGSLQSWRRENYYCWHAGCCSLQVHEKKKNGVRRTNCEQGNIHTKVQVLMLVIIMVLVIVKKSQKNGFFNIFFLSHDIQRVRRRITHHKSHTLVRRIVSIGSRHVGNVRTFGVQDVRRRDSRLTGARFVPHRLIRVRTINSSPAQKKSAVIINRVLRCGF